MPKEEMGRIQCRLKPGKMPVDQYTSDPHEVARLLYQHIKEKDCICQCCPYGFIGSAAGCRSQEVMGFMKHFLTVRSTDSQSVKDQKARVRKVLVKASYLKPEGTPSKGKPSSVSRADAIS